MQNLLTPDSSWFTGPVPERLTKPRCAKVNGRMMFSWAIAKSLLLRFLTKRKNLIKVSGDNK